jgi:hypothetical protein
VAGVSNQPGSDAFCHGYKLSNGVPTRIPLGRDVYQWNWAIRIAYLSSGDSDAYLRIGDTIRWFKIREGLREVVFLVSGGGDAVEITVQEPGVVVCTNELTIGNPVAQP